MLTAAPLLTPAPAPAPIEAPALAPAVIHILKNYDLKSEARLEEVIKKTIYSSSINLKQLKLPIYTIEAIRPSTKDIRLFQHYPLLGSAPIGRLDLGC